MSCNTMYFWSLKTEFRRNSCFCLQGHFEALFASCVVSPYAYRTSALSNRVPCHHASYSDRHHADPIHLEDGGGQFFFFFRINILPPNKVTLYEIRIFSKHLAVFSNLMFQWRLFSRAVRRHVAGVHKSRSVGRRGEQILYAAARYWWLLSIQVASCYLLAAEILKMLPDFWKVRASVTCGLVEI